ncbi:phage integrase central domain-containing protein [Piscirickettsia salmonis]|uniref:phage integrase central domain-containing protein n=1 Tax=Piscirickettsia salmonis TaxID=1238 RepID=UPI00249F1757|nr:tyrosine-type recombinase/integrase [Piscirickettsia salmonis]
MCDGGGLQLRVRPNGTKSWLFDYRPPNVTKRVNISFGSFPEISLAEARKQRDKAKEFLANGIDPREYRDSYLNLVKKEAENTFLVVAQQWLEVKKSMVSAKHASKVWQSLEKYIFPTIGQLPISKINAPDTIKLLKPLAENGRLETVKRLCQRLNEVMSYAVNTGVIHSNPLAAIKSAFKAPKKANFLTIRPEELPDFLQTLNRASISITTRCAIEWQLHTMVRPSEAAGARWDELDLENKLWIIPAERMKAKREHTVPLTPSTLSLLEIMKPIADSSAYIFPSGRIPKQPMNSQSANVALKRMGYGGRLVAHGLRSIAKGLIPRSLLRKKTKRITTRRGNFPKYLVACCEDR